MWRDEGSVFLRPEEVGAIVQALRAEARAPLKLGGESAIRGLTLRDLQHAIDALLQEGGTDTGYALQRSDRTQPKPDRRRHGAHGAHRGVAGDPGPAHAGR